MAVESQPPLKDESMPPYTGGDFESSREARRRRRRERRVERERTRQEAHAPIEPLTIWVRSDPNRLQPQHTEQQPVGKPEVAEHKQAAPKHEAKPARRKVNRMPEQAPVKEQKKPPVRASESELNVFASDPRVEGVIPAPETPKADRAKSTNQKSMEDMPTPQTLPRLDIRPRHFYTEPEVRQPHEAEEEHDILPATGTKGEQKQDSEPQAPEQPVTDHTEAEPAEQLSSTGEQLQELAEQTAQRAAELERKHQAEERSKAEQEQEHETNESMSAIVEGDFESDTRMGREELLALGDSIRIEGVSLTEMFHAGRLDEEGLRRIVVEFLRGQRIEKIAADEVLRQQMRFERDPQLRQVPVAVSDEAMKRATSGMQGQQRRVFSTYNVRRQADRIADSLADGIDRAVEAAESNPNLAKTVGGTLAVIIYFAILILIIRS